MSNLLTFIISVNALISKVAIPINFMVMDYRSHGFFMGQKIAKGEKL
jgi:hypothetical protein